MAFRTQVGQENFRVPATTRQRLDNRHSGLDAKKLQRFLRVAILVPRLDFIRLRVQHCRKCVAPFSNCCCSLRCRLGHFSRFGFWRRLWRFSCFGFWRRLAGTKHECKNGYENPVHFFPQ